MNEAYQTFHEKVSRVEYLTGYEGNTFAFTGDVREDLLGITAVHPMREEAVKRLLNRAGAGWQDVEELISNGSLVEVEYQGKTFYMRKLPGLSSPGNSHSSVPVKSVTDAWR